jgi:hypothetical protein
MIATEKKMHSLKAMAEHYRKDDPDVALDSLNTAWRRAQTQGDLMLGKFGRGREDLTNYENDFALDWFKADKQDLSVKTAIATPLGSEMRDEINRLKSEKNALSNEKTTIINAYNAEKSAKETAEKVIVELTNNAKLLAGQITSFKSQIEYRDKSAASGLSSQTDILQKQIASLEAKLLKAETKLDAAQTDERQRANAAKIAHDEAIEAVNFKLVEAMQAYENQVAQNDKNWFKKLQEAEQKNADLVRAHEAELAPHLQSEAEREAKVTVLEIINYGEIAAAVVGAVIMFKIVGLVLAFPAALWYYDSMKTVKLSSSWASSKFAIFSCVVLSFAFGFVHYNTALKYNDSDAYPKWAVAIVAALILSGISVAALWQNYLKKEENL